MKSILKSLGTAFLGGVIALGMYHFFVSPQQVIVQQSPANLLKTAAYSAASAVSNPDFSVTAEKVTPSVVHITSKVTGSVASQSQIPPMFRDFFGDRFEYEQRQTPQIGSGSGVIIGKEGYILTNNHVIDEASEIEVSLYDKRTFKAKVIGTDPSTDLALIKVEAENLPALAFGNSDEAKVGEWVLAVGNPFNLESTVTAGIISAKGRNINILGGDYSIESFIQTDAAVNPGNSGGALVDLEGNLIGINTAIASPTGSYSGYSFAVPADIARKVAEDLMTYGKVQRAVLGIRIRGVDGNFAREQGLDINEGVYVAEVMEEGSARQSGLKQGDVIVNVDGKTIRSVSDLQETIGRHRPGDVVNVTVNRKGSLETKKVTLKSQTGGTEVVSATATEISRELGAEFETLTKGEASKLGVESGVKVTKLYPGKLRSRTGIREGFVITRVNKSAVKSAEELNKILQSEQGGILLEGIYPGSNETHYYGFGM